jgi:LCP family protein required for cell wall assembly
MLAAAAVAWAALGTFSSASGQEKPVVIQRAHAGSHRPAFHKPIFILVLGTDARSGNPRGARNDSIHIVAVDPATKRGSIVGIPRDSYVPLAGGGRGKINSALGPDRMIATVENLSGCRFDYFMQTSFEGFQQLVNDFGGLPLHVPRRVVDVFANAYIEPGRQVLSGAQALGFARTRKTGLTPQGDFDRSRNQGTLMIAALGKAREQVQAFPGRALHYLAIMRKRVRLNISVPEALRLGLLALQVKPEDVTNEVIDGSGGNVGGASVVLVTERGRSLLADVCADGVISAARS